MKLTTAYLALALGALTLQQSQAASGIDFKIDSYNIESGETTFPFYDSTPAGLQVTGTDFGDQLTVTFAQIDITGLTEFKLTGTLHSENFGTYFTLTLFDADFDSREYVGLFDYGSGQATISLTSNFGPGPALNNVIGFLFVTNGIGESFDYTFEKIEAIPEPSVYALSFLAAGGAYLIRRRRAMLSQ